MKHQGLKARQPTKAKVQQNSSFFVKAPIKKLSYLLVIEQA
jgi:hypothetical protein